MCVCVCSLSVCVCAKNKDNCLAWSGHNKSCRVNSRRVKSRRDEPTQLTSSMSQSGNRMHSQSSKWHLCQAGSQTQSPSLSLSVSPLEATSICLWHLLVHSLPSSLRGPTTLSSSSTTDASSNLPLSDPDQAQARPRPGCFSACQQVQTCADRGGISPRLNAISVKRRSSRLCQWLCYLSLAHRLEGNPG